MKDSDILVKLIQLVQGKGEISPQAVCKVNPKDQQGYLKIKEGGAKRQYIDAYINVKSTKGALCSHEKTQNHSWLFKYIL